MTVFLFDVLLSFLIFLRLISVFGFQGTTLTEFYQSFKNKYWFVLESLVNQQFLFKSGSHLLSHIVSNAVPSAAWVLTIVFGMGTGVSPKRIATRNILLSTPLVPPSHSFGSALLHLTRVKALMHPFAYEDFREQAPGFLSSDVCALALW